MVGEKDADVHVDLVEFVAHLLGGGDHLRALLAARKLGFVDCSPRREAGDVEVVLLHALYVIQSHPPGHLAPYCEMPWRLVDVDVAVHDEDVLEFFLFLPRSLYGVRHADLLSYSAVNRLLHAASI